MTELMEAARVLGVGSVAHPVGSDVDYLGMVALGFPVKVLDRIVPGKYYRHMLTVARRIGPARGSRSFLHNYRFWTARI